MHVLIAVLVTLVSFVTDWPTIVKPAVNQVPRLEMADDTGKGVCSGVVIHAKSGFLLTAAHCVDHPAGSNFSMTVNGRHAVVLKVNTLLDMAIVKFDPKDEIQVVLADTVPPVGSEVAVVGYPFGDERLAVQFGRVAQVLNAPSRLLWINADVIPGDSGGAVIDDQGLLIGLTTSIFYAGPSHMGAAVPVDQIRDFAAGYLPVKVK